MTQFSLTLNESATAQLQLLELPCDWCGKQTDRSQLRAYSGGQTTTLAICPTCVATLGLSTTAPVNV